MLEQSQNGEVASPCEHKLVDDSNARLAPVWKCFHQVMLAVDRLSRALNRAAAETGFAAPNTIQKRQETNRRVNKERFCFFDEGDGDLKRMISRIMEQSGKTEVYQRPPDLLEVARSVGVLHLKIADIEPAGSKERRAERAALARYLQIRRGRTFVVPVLGTDRKIMFEAISTGKTRRYKFTEVAE
jgi:hypothetical protein